MWVSDYLGWAIRGSSSLAIFITLMPDNPMRLVASRLGDIKQICLI